MKPALALALLGLLAAAPAHADKSKAKADARAGKLGKTEDTVLGGSHFRIKTEHGVVHVWIPPGYDRANAGTVVYVHGYWTDVDGAWKHHALAAQFKKSGQNALFVVPDAPSSNQDSVKWDSLADLRKAVTRANIRLPDGPTIVIGHSGAFRTIAKWVDHKLLAQVILLDAMYGGQSAFDAFIASGKRAKNHKLLLIGSDTAEASRSFAKRFPFAVVRDKVPPDYASFSNREKHAKLLYIHSQYGHGDIAEGGKVLPLVLRLTPLAKIGAAPKPTVAPSVEPTAATTGAAASAAGAASGQAQPVR